MHGTQYDGGVHGGWVYGARTGWYPAYTRMVPGIYHKVPKYKGTIGIQVLIYTLSTVVRVPMADVLLSIDAVQLSVADAPRTESVVSWRPVTQNGQNMAKRPNIALKGLPHIQDCT